MPGWNSSAAILCDVLCQKRFGRLPNDRQSSGIKLARNGIGGLRIGDKVWRLHELGRMKQRPENSQKWSGRLLIDELAGNRLGGGS